MKSEAEYKKLEKDMQAYRPVLAKAAETILDQEVSAYPIFIVHRQGVNIGVPLVQAEGEEAPWSVNASTLEELATKKVIPMDKVDNFREVYKDPQEYFCLFVISDSGAEFVFLPREERGE